MKFNPKLLISVIVSGVGLALAVWTYKIYDQYTSSSHTDYAEVRDKGTSGQPKIGGPFKLVDHQGNLRTEADFKGKYMMIYFGYSFCPDICPMALSSMSQALNDLGPKARQITPIFVTIDPERDSVPHLARYISSYHPSFMALTGDPNQIEQAKKAYRVYGTKVKPDGTTADYVMDHSSIVYIMDRQGRFVSHFSHTTPPSEMKRVLDELLK